MDLLGQIVWVEEPTSRPSLQLVEIMGMRVLQGELSQRGHFLKWRQKKLLRALRRQGVGRLLAPSDFSGWEMAHEMGFARVNVRPFLRSNSGRLLLMAMKKRGLQPQSCTVALRGTRVGRDMTTAADWLQPQVRDIAITACHGGEHLQRYLRHQWGLAVATDGSGVDGVIRYDEGGAPQGRVVLSLFGSQPQLGDLVPNITNFPQFLQTEPLELLAALWEAGKIEGDTLEFYLT